MNDLLGTYLQDHLAGAVVGIDLLESLRDEHAGQTLGEFAGELLLEVEGDRTTLLNFLEEIGAQQSVLKEATAWLAEKASRLKLSHSISGQLGTFEALETLTLGILGKRALWSALKTVAAQDLRLHTLDLDSLMARAESQYARVEQRRLAVAAIALRSAAHASDAS